MRDRTPGLKKADKAEQPKIDTVAIALKIVKVNAIIRAATRTTPSRPHVPEVIGHSNVLLVYAIAVLAEGPLQGCGVCVHSGRIAIHPRQTSEKEPWEAAACSSPIGVTDREETTNT